MRALALVLLLVAGCHKHKPAQQPALGESTAPGPAKPAAAPEQDGPQGVEAPISGGKPTTPGPSEPPPPPESR